MSQTVRPNPESPISPMVLAGLFSGLLGLVVLVGWYTHSVTLVQVLPAFVPMQYNTALGFFLSGVALLSTARGLRRLAIGATAIVMAIGCLTLIEYMSGLNLAIDQLLMEHYVQVKTSHPGRMAPNTALCFLLTGVRQRCCCGALATPRRESRDP